MTTREGGARRAFATEVERLAHEFRGSLGHLEEALAALADGEGLPPGLEPEVLFAGGVPRVRPVLVLLASQLRRESDAAAAAEVAYVAELLQTAIRLHDAALGKQHGLRRRAARRVIGGAAHWLGASHVTLRALEIARRAPTPDILGDALETLREVSEGQALGEAIRGRPATVREAEQVAEGHTGAVFAFSCRAGGRIGGAERAEVVSLGRYGRHVGVGVHIAEELALLERVGSDGPDVRPAAWRILPGRPVLYPVAFAGSRDPAIHALWRRMTASPDPVLARELVDGVGRAGGFGAGREALVLHAWAARRALQGLPDGQARDALDGIAASLTRSAA